MGQPCAFRQTAAAAAALALIAATPADKQKAAVIELVKSQLKDPASAQFKGVKETSPGYWCGWVNAKNALGGYTGFAVFNTHDGKVAIIPPELSEPQLC